jgi:hypothetical protein
VGRADNYEWDKPVRILYDRGYAVQEAWEWEDADKYRIRFETVERLSPAHMRQDRRPSPSVEWAPTTGLRQVSVHSEGKPAHRAVSE